MWYNSIKQVSITEPLAHSPCSGMGKTIRRVKQKTYWVEKTTVEYNLKKKVSYESKTKQNKQTNKQKELIISKFPDSPIFLSPSFYHWTQCHMIWNICLLSWGQLSWLCPHSVCASPAYLLATQCEKQRLWWHYIALDKSSLCSQSQNDHLAQSLLKQGHPEQGARTTSRWLLKISKEVNSTSSGQLMPALHQPYSKVLPDVQMELPTFRFVPTASCSATGHHWEEPGSVLFALSHQVLIDF